ncbi:MAG: hypothetical protein ACPGO3_10865 [Magnetospiraceae bacterium]
MRASLLSTLFLTTALAGGAMAQDADDFFGELEIAGYASIDARYFINDLEDSSRDNQRLQPSVVLHPELRLPFNNGDSEINLVLHARLDSYDSRRTHADVREANIRHFGDDYDITVGIGKVFWGVTESHHLVDIVNQTDLIEHPDGEDKLGQPMININLVRDFGTLELYALIGYRERTFASRDGRLRDYLPTQNGQPQFEFPDDRLPVDFAARGSKTIGDMDIGISYFHGTQRNPRLPIILDRDGRPVRLAYYGTIDQVGLDMQLTQDAWLYKLEAISRWGDGDDRITAAVGGVEYTVFDVGGSGADLGLIAEYLYDDRGPTASATPYNNDIFVGARLGLNDTQDTSMLAGLFMDQNHGGFTATLEAERRLTDSLSLEGSAVFIFNTPADDVVGGLRQDDFVEIRLIYFF